MEREDILTVDGQKVKVVLNEPVANPKKIAFLFLHGWTGRPNVKAGKFLATQGFYCCLVIMRGHPGSDGDINTVTARTSLDDAVAAYDFLETQVPAGTKIVAVGNSYGSYIAVLLSELRVLAALSLRVPAAYPDGNYDLPKVKDGHANPETRAWRHKAVDFRDNKAFSLLHDFSGNIQILEGKLDDVVPSQTVQNYVNAVADPSRLEYRVMEGWGHSIGSDEKVQHEFEEVLLNWSRNIGTKV